MSDARDAPKGLLPDEGELWAKLERARIILNDGDMMMQVSTVMQYLQNTASARQKSDTLQARVTVLMLVLENLQNILGPTACKCEGQQAEVEYALETIKDALKDV